MGGVGLSLVSLVEPSRSNLELTLLSPSATFECKIIDSNPPRNMIPSDDQSRDDASDDDSAAEIENDLAILAAMNIEDDFSAWSDFRKSLAVPAKRASLESLFLQSSTASKRNLTSSLEDFGGSLEDFGDSEKDDDFKEDSGSCNHVSFASSISPGELRDIRAWNKRLSRETAFSRYYFPEHWELRELKTIANFLDLKDHEARGLYVSCMRQNDIRALFPD
jgi:hypothetical protein